MAKKKTEAATEPLTNGTTAPPTSPGETAEPSTNGSATRAPLKTLSYEIGHDCYVQASIWAREVPKKDGSSFVTYDVSLRKRYVDGKTGEWKSAYSYHATELYACVHALISAAGSITELRAAEVPF